MIYLTNDRTGEYYQLDDSAPLRYSDKGNDWVYVSGSALKDEFPGLHPMQLQAFVHNQWVDVYLSNPPQTHEFQIKVTCSPGFDSREFLRELESMCGREQDIIISKVHKEKKEE